MLLSSDEKMKAPLSWWIYNLWFDEFVISSSARDKKKIKKLPKEVSVASDPWVDMVVERRSLLEDYTVLLVAAAMVVVALRWNWT